MEKEEVIKILQELYALIEEGEIDDSLDYIDDKILELNE